MPKVLNFADPSNGRPGLGATIQLDSGEPCLISVAQAGVRVKKSRLGLLGAILFEEKVVYKAALTAKALDFLFPDTLLPAGFTNPVLRAFANAVLHCATCAEVAAVLNEAIMRAEAQAKCPIADLEVIPRNSKCTFALLQMGEQQIKSTLNDFDSRLNSAAGVVVQMIIHDACDNIGQSILNAQFDEVPKGFHIIVMFGLCLVMSIYFLLKEEGQTIDAKELGQGMVGALIIMRSYEDKQEQYKLANTLLKRFIAAGPKTNEWQNNLNQLVSMYLLSWQNENLSKHNYPSLFGSMLKTIISAVELPT